MALQSEISPRLIGDANKDTKIDGDTKSNGNSSSSSTDEEVDLEDGEILDSEGEEEKKEEKKDFTNSSMMEALDKSFVQSIEQIANLSKKGENALIKNTSPPGVPKTLSPRKLGTKPSSKYLDREGEGEGGWFPPSPKYKSKFDDKPFDYKKELAAYRGTPPSSPDRKHSRDDKLRKKRLSKKSKKPGKKTIKRKDIKGMRVTKFKKDSLAPRGQICKFFKEGKCAKGSDCAYSHSSPPGFKKKELCKFYLNGHCNKGKDCLYMHSEFPCKFYHTGSECYAKDDCRFSHAPLSEEMKRILADYLKIHHADLDEFMKDIAPRPKRRPSRSPSPPRPPPPPAKRPCLLGSPPRHIREAEETRRWQREMRAQRQLHPGFEIRIEGGSPPESPPQEEEETYYPEDYPPDSPPAMSSPPRRHCEVPEGPPDFPRMSPPPAFPALMGGGAPPHFKASPRDDYAYEEDYEEDSLPAPNKPEVFGWKTMDHSLPPRKEDPVKEFVDPDSQDFTSDVKFDETTQFSEMESSVDDPPPLSPDRPPAEAREEEDATETAAPAEKPAPEQPEAPPIVIPSHLPRKQRELFMRIQQHQRKNEEAEEGLSDAGGGAEKEEDKADPESQWYSSEDDDDDADRPLTDVLKKLQQAPPPEKKPDSTGSKPAVNLMEMLNKIQQTSQDKSKAANAPSGSFWEKILGGTSAPPAAPPLLAEPKRRALLPNPQPAVKVETVPPKDPRLKNRDPRTLASAGSTTAASKPNMTVPPLMPLPVPTSRTNLPLPNATLGIPTCSTLNLPKSATSEQNSQPVGHVHQIQDINTLFPKIPSLTSDSSKEVPYRLHWVHTKPPNYTPYINASQSNPSLLKDPRLRKHLNISTPRETSLENGKEPEEPKPPAQKDVPPIPKLLLKYENSETINIFEPSPAKGEPEKIPGPKSLSADPRRKRRDSRSNSGSDTPPRLTIVEGPSSLPSQDQKMMAPVLEMESTSEAKWDSDQSSGLPPLLEKNWVPPVLEKNWTVSLKKDEPPVDLRKKVAENEAPVFVSMQKLEENVDQNTKTVPPLVIKKCKPTPASHLPKAIADPRMAKLHTRSDPRRPRAASDKNVLKKSPPQDSSDSCPPAEDSNGSPEADVGRTTSPEVETKPKGKKEAEPTSSVEVETEPKGKREADQTTSVEVETKPKGKREADQTAEVETKPKSIPKKRRLSDKSEEKKKTVHRNRKSSMDYASPLNSCDSSGSSLSYNSYNQRPKRTAQSVDVTDSSRTARSERTDTPPISDFLLSDNSSLDCDNSSDVNLKDRFKTIDPTASPFC